MSVRRSEIPMELEVWGGLFCFAEACFPGLFLGLEGVRWAFGLICLDCPAGLSGW